MLLNTLSRLYMQVNPAQKQTLVWVVSKDLGWVIDQGDFYLGDISELVQGCRIYFKLLNFIRIYCIVLLENIFH